MFEKLSARDLPIFKKLGMKRYLEGMSIQRIMPKLPWLPDLTKEARQRLKWMDYYHQCQNVSKTCRYFGIARKTFYHWLKRYDPQNLLTLEACSRRPNHVRQWQVTREEESRIKALRKRYIRYGKEKLKVIYERMYHTLISSWKIQRVIEKHKLYYSPKKNYLLQRKRRHNQPKKRITEFAKYFRMAAGSLKLEHYFSRPRTPKDNAFDERFNRTLQDEFIALGHLTDDCAIFNRELTEWLIEYNFHRPHQSLRYETPIQFHNQHYKVLPMYPASTKYCKKEILCYNTNSEHW